MSQALAARPVRDILKWPSEGITHVPLQVYVDGEIYLWEQDRLFRGPAWSYLGIEADIPNAGDYFTTKVGDTPVIVVRSASGSVNALVNRCAHKGVTVCYQNEGNAKTFTCPYHNWIYDHEGKLTTVPFERGVQKKGGMPEDFDKGNYRLQPLRVESIKGLIFGTFSQSVKPLEQYMGEQMVGHIRRTIHGKPRVIGRYRQYMHNNWKLYAENARDNYHPSLLHGFFTTFRINRLSAEGGTAQDPTGWHHISYTKRYTDKHEREYETGLVRAQKKDYGLEDPSLIDQWIEFDDQVTSCIQCIFPNFVLQQILNSIAIRQIVPLGPEKCELVWTYLGFDTDTPEQTAVRVKQGNLVGPAGLVSMEDGVIGEFVQRGIQGDLDGNAVLLMGGREVAPVPTRATETSVRGFWRTYRELMDV
jgi:anthranilate 1,2-dioxygenase large subunit/terephthalate 1,2-dioxygenase oxygenase component alpha subunit